MEIIWLKLVRRVSKWGGTIQTKVRATRAGGCGGDKVGLLTGIAGVACVSRAGVSTGSLMNWVAGEISKDILQALCNFPNSLFAALAVLIEVTGRGQDL